jgi:hypothetical protein
MQLIMSAATAVGENEGAEASWRARDHNPEKLFSSAALLVSSGKGVHGTIN